MGGKRTISFCPRMTAHGQSSRPANVLPFIEVSWSNYLAESSRFLGAIDEASSASCAVIFGFRLGS